MGHVTEKAFLKDAYLTACEAKVIGITERGDVVLDQTNFYAASGGQPSDCGYLELENGSSVAVTDCYYGSTKEEIVLAPAKDAGIIQIGDVVICHIDWERRYQLMKLHTACHLLSVVCPYPITGAAISLDGARLDFDMGKTSVDKEPITQGLMALISENHPISTSWISETELDTNPSIIKSKNVRPPRGFGDIRLVSIGQSSSVDSQPCGGTHVSETAEIGDIHIAKIENKGRENRRFRIKLGSPKQ